MSDIGELLARITEAVARIATGVLGDERNELTEDSRTALEGLLAGVNDLYGYPWGELASTGDAATQPMTRDGFQARLFQIRDAANRGVAEGVTAESDDVWAIWETEDGRAVWHAAEIALAMLRPGYIPKREALSDLYALLDELGDAAGRREDTDDDESGGNA